VTQGSRRRRGRRRNERRRRYKKRHTADGRDEKVEADEQNVPIGEVEEGLIRAIALPHPCPRNTNKVHEAA